jgi:hypothetical protein
MSKHFTPFFTDTLILLLTPYLKFVFTIFFYTYKLIKRDEIHLKIFSEEYLEKAGLLKSTQDICIKKGDSPGKHGTNGNPR